MIRKIINLVAFLCCLYPNHTIAQIENDDFNLNVLSYHVQLEPNILKQYLEGNVIVNFLTTNAVKEVVFDCGNLTINNVKGQSVESFRQKDKKLIITFSKTVKTKQELRIFYHYHI